MAGFLLAAAAEDHGLGGAAAVAAAAHHGPKVMPTAGKQDGSAAHRYWVLAVVGAAGLPLEMGSMAKPPMDFMPSSLLCEEWYACRRGNVGMGK